MKTINRRDFVGVAAAGTTGLLQRQTRRPTSPRPVTPTRDTPKNPNRRLQLGLIGCGWYGMVDLKAALQAGAVDVVGLCDVDSDHLSSSATEVQKAQGTLPKTFKDYRQLLELPGLDAVIIATPPHWHALPFIAACEKGLDIYCEKPLAYDIREGRAMVNAAAQSKRIVQVGFQRRNSLAIQQAGAYVREGHPGRLVQIEAQINYAAQPRDPTVQAPPPSLDWEWWCGPAPKLPYSPNIGHIAWRLEAAYGNGHMVDWGIHWIDAIRRFLGAKTPRTVQAMGGIYYLKNKITTPDILQAQFDFDECPVIWRHRLWGSTEYDPETSNGIFFYCEKETVFATDDRWVVVPNDKKSPKKVIPAAAGKLELMHMANFLESVRSRQRPLCDTLDGFYSTATVQLGMIAYRAGDRIKWDSETDQIEDNREASNLLKREYRAPWKHPANFA